MKVELSIRVALGTVVGFFVSVLCFVVVVVVVVGLLVVFLFCLFLFLFFFTTESQVDSITLFILICPLSCCYV